MFFRKIALPFRELVPAGVGKIRPSGASGWPPSSPPDRGSLVKALKIAIAAAILAAGIAAMFSAHGKIISNNAVIAANLVSLRTPIDGTATGLPDRVGAMAEKGRLIAHIENPLVNDEHAADLRAHQTRIQADLKAAKDNRAELLNLRSELVRRDEIHTKLNSERLASLVEEAGRTMAALNAKERQAQHDFDLRVPLEIKGIVSNAEMDRRRSILEAAQQHAAAQSARLAALRTEAEAAKQGVLAGPTGGTDKSYSAQRADQIAMEISSLDKTIAALAAEASETQSRLSAEQQRIELLRSANILAPSAGMIWKLGAANGERLGTGDMAAEIVDCNAPFLLAAIPQDRFSDVEAGGTAQFRLSGERTERTGTVVSVTGHGDLTQGQHYAAMPLDEPSTVIVTIALPQTKGGPDGHNTNDCLIGRSARVLLPATGGGFVDQFLRRVF